MWWVSTVRYVKGKHWQRYVGQALSEMWWVRIVKDVVESTGRDVVGRH